MDTSSLWQRLKRIKRRTSITLGLIGLACLIALWLAVSCQQPVPTTPTPTSTVAAPTVTPTRAPSPTPSPTVPVATAEPTRAPTRIPPTPEPPKPVTKVTKWGVGVYGLHASSNELKSLLTAKPTIIVMQDPDIGFARDVRYFFPKAFIIGRTHFAEQPLDNPEQRGIELADKIAEMAVPRKGLVDAWQGYNEPVAHNDYPAYRAWNTLQVAYAKRLQDHYGIPAVVGNDAPGAIEPEDYATYFADAIRTGAYFGIHAYGGPEATTLNTDDAIYFALRYRLIHDALESAGIKDVKMVLTEVGLGEGWEGHAASEEDMANQFMWLADELEKDPYVIGMAAYGIFADGGWYDFRLQGTRILEILGEYQPRRPN